MFYLSVILLWISSLSGIFTFVRFYQCITINESLASRSVYIDLCTVTNHTINGATIARALSSGGHAPKIQAVVPLRKDIYQIITVDIQSAQVLLSVGIDINGRHLDFKDELGQEAVKVTIRGLPLYFPLDETAKFLKKYGRLRSNVMPEKWQGTNILTGGHFAYMTVEKPIPGRTTIGEDFKVIVVYKNQPKVCFKCTKPGHLARECPQHSYKNTTQGQIGSTQKQQASEKPRIPQKPSMTSKVNRENVNTTVATDRDDDELVGELVIDEKIQEIRHTKTKHTKDPAEEGELSEEAHSSDEAHSDREDNPNEENNVAKSPENKRRRKRSGSGKRRRSPKHR